MFKLDYSRVFNNDHALGTQPSRISKLWLLLEWIPIYFKLYDPINLCCKTWWSGKTRVVKQKLLVLLELPILLEF